MEEIQIKVNWSEEHGHEGYFQNTAYFKERGYDVENNTDYQIFYMSKIPVKVVDDIKAQIFEEKRQEVISAANSNGVTLTEAQIDALADIRYQGHGINTILQTYKYKGLTEETRTCSIAFASSRKNDRGDRRWQLFSTGKYLDSSGNQIMVVQKQ